MDDIQLSVIIPIYNAERYLEYCLESLVEISKESEILLIDDGSTDKSAEICRKFVNKNNHYMYVRKENGGPSSARNRGIEIARGKWITFIDADDWVCSGTYLKALKELKIMNDDTHIFYFLSIYVKNDKVIPKKLYSKEKGKFSAIKIKKGLLNSDDMYIKQYIKRGFNFHGPVAKFYKREIIISNDIRFPETLSWGEDICFNFEVLEYAQNLFYSEMIGYYYRKNDESIMNSYKPDKSKQMLRLMLNMYCFIKDQPEYIEEFYKMGLRQYLYALKMDLFNKNNTLSYKERRKKAKNLIFTEPFKECIKKASLSNLKPQLFLMGILVKSHSFWVIDKLLKIMY